MERKPITNKVLWIFAIGQFGWSLLSGIISTWLVHLYTGSPEKFGDTNGLFADFISQNTLLVGLTLFGIITAVGRIFDAVTDPLIASWSDKANFKGGRRIPFMKWIAVPFAAVTVLVFVLPSFSNIVLNDTLIFALLMLFYLFMTIYCTPYNALIAELGDTQKHRINVSTYISFTYIAGFSVATLIPTLAGMFRGSGVDDILARIASENGITLEALSEQLAEKTVILKDIASQTDILQIASVQQNSMRMAIGIMAAVACVAMLIPALYIKERAYIDSKPVKSHAFKSLIKTFGNAQFRRFVYADVIYFFAVTLFQTGLADYETKLMGISSDNTFTLTVLMTVVSLALYPAVNLLAPKLGKKTLIIVGFFTYSAVFLITGLCGQGFIWGIIVAVCAGIPMAILGILPQACVADVSELSTLETGEDRSGMFFAARTFAMKLGQALSLLVYTSVTVAKIVDGVKTVEPSQYRLTAIIATVACLIGAVLFIFYNEKKIMNGIVTLRQKKAAENRES